MLDQPLRQNTFASICHEREICGPLLGHEKLMVQFLCTTSFLVQGLHCSVLCIACNNEERPFSG